MAQHRRAQVVVLRSHQRERPCDAVARRPRLPVGALERFDA